MNGGATPGSDPKRTFNPRMLVLARHAQGFVQEDVATHIGVSQSKYAKFEIGLLLPTEAEVRDLSEYLKEPVEFFHLPDKEYGPGSTCRSFLRHRKTMLAGDLKRIVAVVNKARIRVTRLADGIHFEGPGTLECIDIDSVNGDVESIAAMVRAGWRLPPGPVADLTGAVEDRGVFVIRCHFGTDKLDAMSQAVPGAPSVVCMNADMPGERARHSLAHELGHLVMHSLGSGDHAEEEADRFAAAFLMPGDVIREELARGVTIGTLAALKHKWRVSMKSLVKRAETLGVLATNQARWLYIKMNKMGWQKGEPFPVEPEQPQLVRELIDFRVKDQGIPAGEVFERLLLATEERLRTEFYGEQRRLRLA